MTAHDALARLTALGCTVKLDGTALRVGPKQAITEEVRALVTAHKAALVALLSAPAPGEGAGPWRYHSAVLDAELWLCLTQADAEAVRAEGGVPYLPEEVQLLRAIQQRAPDVFAEKLQAIHAWKETCDATIDGVTYAAVVAEEPARDVEPDAPRVTDSVT